MDKQHAIDYIGSVSWRHSLLGLQRIDSLLRAMGSPQDKLRFIHVAGTNGKGSVCTMLSSVLTAAGYKTGCYTSPFVNCFNERMQVDHQPITDDELAELTGEVRVFADAMEDHPTEFEMVTAIGLLFFLRKKCDIVVLEVGLGGRLDATNVIPPPEIAVITSIGLDHTAELGEELGMIAAEKAGIIKPGGEAVSSPQYDEAAEVLKATCRQLGVPLHVTDMARLKLEESGLTGQRFLWDDTLELKLPLAGVYQLPNAATALTALGVLQKKGYEIGDEALQAGFDASHWPARMELLCRTPVFLLDGGHNQQGARALAQSLEMLFPQQKWVFLVGVMADKNWQEMTREVLPIAERFFCVAPDMSRALPAPELAAGISHMGVPLVEACANVHVGIAAAVQAAGADGLVCAFGSLYMAGEIREYFGFGALHKGDFFHP